MRLIIFWQPPSSHRWYCCHKIIDTPPPLAVNSFMDNPLNHIISQYQSQITMDMWQFLSDKSNAKFKPLTWVVVFVTKAVANPWRIPINRPPSEMVRNETRPRTMLVASTTTSACSISLKVVIMLYKTTATPSTNSNRGGTNIGRGNQYQHK